MVKVRGTLTKYFEVDLNCSIEDIKLDNFRELVAEEIFKKYNMTSFVDMKIGDYAEVSNG